jgi:hypothetical protein
MEAAGASPHFLHFWRHLLWLKDESPEDSANISLHCHLEFPASLDTFKVSLPPRRKAGTLPALDPDIIAAEWSERSVLGSRDIDGQNREGERAGAKESMG